MLMNVIIITSAWLFSIVVVLTLVLLLSIRDRELNEPVCFSAISPFNLKPGFSRASEIGDADDPHDISIVVVLAQRFS